MTSPRPLKRRETLYQQLKQVIHCFLVRMIETSSIFFKTCFRWYLISSLENRRMSPLRKVIIFNKLFRTPPPPPSLIGEGGGGDGVSWQEFYALKLFDVIDKRSPSPSKGGCRVLMPWLIDVWLIRTNLPLPLLGKGAGGMGFHGRNSTLLKLRNLIFILYLHHIANFDGFWPSSQNTVGKRICIVCFV